MATEIAARLNDCEICSRLHPKSCCHGFINKVKMVKKMVATRLIHQAGRLEPHASPDKTGSPRISLRRIGTIQGTSAPVTPLQREGLR